MKLVQKFWYVFLIPLPIIIAYIGIAWGDPIGFEDEAREICRDSNIYHSAPDVETYGSWGNVYIAVVGDGSLNRPSAKKMGLQGAESIEEIDTLICIEMSEE